MYMTADVTAIASLTYPGNSSISVDVTALLIGQLTATPQQNIVQIDSNRSTVVGLNAGTTTVFFGSAARGEATVTVDNTLRMYVVGVDLALVTEVSLKSSLKQANGTATVVANSSVVGLG